MNDEMNNEGMGAQDAPLLIFGDASGNPISEISLAPGEQKKIKVILSQQSEAVVQNFQAQWNVYDSNHQQTDSVACLVNPDTKKWLNPLCLSTDDDSVGGMSGNSLISAKLDNGVWRCMGKNPNGQFWYPRDLFTPPVPVAEFTLVASDDWTGNCVTLELDSNYTKFTQTADTAVPAASNYTAPCNYSMMLAVNNANSTSVAPPQEPPAATTEPPKDNEGGNDTTAKPSPGKKDVKVFVDFEFPQGAFASARHTSYKVIFYYNTRRLTKDVNGNEVIVPGRKDVEDVKDYAYEINRNSDKEPRLLTLQEGEYIYGKIRVLVLCRILSKDWTKDLEAEFIPSHASISDKRRQIPLSFYGIHLGFKVESSPTQKGIGLSSPSQASRNRYSFRLLYKRNGSPVPFKGQVPAATGTSTGTSSSTGTTGSGSSSTSKPAGESESQKKLREVNELVKTYPMIAIEDGYNDPPELQQEPNKEGVWVRALRQPKHPDGIWFMVNDEINNQLIYPGNIVLVDKEKDFTKNMKEIPFRSGERKPLRFDAKFSTKNSSTVLNSFTRVDVNDFVDDCLREFKEKGYELASNTAWEYEQSTRTEGITLGGTIKGINFSGSALERNKTVTVAYMKQIMYTVSLDNQYSNASDLFTDQVNLDQFKQNIDKNGGAGIVAPAIIDAVRYGRLITVWAVQEGNKPVSLSIDKMFNISVGDTQNNTKFILRVYGGKAGEENFSLSSDSEETIENALKMFKEVDKKAIETALPIEYTLKSLGNMTTNIQWKVLPYFKSYIPRVILKVKDGVMGVKPNVRVWALKFMPYGDSGRDFDYVYYKSTYCESPVPFYMSPKSLCIDVVFEMHRGAKYDFNVMLPCIPYERIEGPESDGYWWFYVLIPSCTYLNAKHIDLIPNVPGAVLSEDEWFYMSKHDDAPINKFDKVHATEKQILQYYLEWMRRKMQEKSYLSWESPVKDLHDLRSYYPRE